MLEKVTNVITALRDSYNLANPTSSAIQSKGPLLGKDRLPILETTPQGIPLTISIVNAWEDGYIKDFDANPGHSVTDKNIKLQGFAQAREIISGWNDIANSQIDCKVGGFFAVGVSGGALLTGLAIAAPTVSTFALTRASLITNVGIGFTETTTGVSVTTPVVGLGAASIIAAERATGALTSIGRNRVTFQGLEVRAVRDLSHVDDATLSVMAKDGFAAKLPNGEKLYLHHHQQNPAGFIVEIPSSKHSIGNVNQHPFGNTPGSGLTAQQRTDFNVWRGDYWRARAQAEIQRRAGQ